MRKEYLYIITLLLVTLVFAQTNSIEESDWKWDNAQTFVKEEGNYGTYHIKDSILKLWDLGKVKDITLKSNTFSCLKNCEATKEITIYKETSLIDDVRFYRLYKDGSRQLSNIESYEFLLKTESGWQSYELGTIMPIGTYEIKLIGEKKFNLDYDWQVLTSGIWSEEWATWTSSFNDGLTSYYAFENNTDLVFGERNLTVNDGQILFNAGLIGNAGDFNAARNMNISYTAYDPQWNFTSNTTFNIWLYRTLAATDQAVWGREGQYAYITAANALTQPGNGWGALTIPNGASPVGAWQMQTYVVNDTNASLYVDGILNLTTNLNPAGHLGGESNISLGSGLTGVGDFEGLMDEMGTWNRSLTATEISDLYNGGAGLTYVPGAHDIIQSYPIDNYVTIDNTVGIGCNFTTGVSNFSNVTIRVYDSTGDMDYNNNITGLNTNSYNAIWTTSFLPTDTYNWSCGFMAHDLTTDISSNRTLNISNYIINSETYNYTVYETALETYIINITANSSLTAADLIWNGTAYAGTASADTWVRTIDVPQGVANKSFHWNITYSGSITQSTPHEITINSTNLSICEGVGGTTPFINFTFLDEETLLAVNATADLATWNYWLGSGGISKSLLFTNTTENLNYAFCATPNQTLHNNLTFQYASTGYPQRVHVRASDLNNATTNQVLYLLSSTDGIYSSIQIVSSSGAPISGVTVQVEREFSGVWTLIGQDTSDSAGLVTFWVNPDYNHRFTFTKTGCTGAIQTIRPTQTTYTQTLNCEGDTSDIYISQIEGIRYTRSPRSGILYPGLTNFTYTLFAEKDNIANAKFEIRNLTGSTLNSTSSVCASSGCVLSFTYNATNGENIKGRYYVDIGEGYFLVEADAFWRLIATNVSDTGTIKEFWLNFRILFDEWGADEVDLSNKLEYSRIVFIFLMLAIALALFNKSFGNYDGSYPGAFAAAITMVILMGSLAGGLTGQGFFYYSGLFGDSQIAEFMNNYILALLSILMTATIMMATVRRNS